MWGLSGGGPHVLACAALLPDLVCAAASLDMQARVPGADLTLLTDQAVSMQQALAPGIEGSWDDCVAQITPWGFDVTQTSIPVLLLHGGQDRAVPFSHGQWLAAHIPGAETWFFDDEGHALREAHIEDVHTWLIDRS
jgi:pimeloyl-ACP methyl ester carboxylesterase